MTTNPRSGRPVPPGQWLGLLGGGQLGRMFAMAAQSLGYRVAVLDPGRGGPAASVADEHFEADYLDAPALEHLALQCAAVTTEFENVPAQSLAFLAEHAFTSPSAESVAVAQDRIAEKRFVASCGIAVAPHAVIETIGDLDAVDDGLFPAILKSSRFGYDGKGQVRVADRAEARDGFESLGGHAAVLEKRLDLAFEASVIVARGEDGATAVYAPAENLHRSGILAVTIVPSPRIDGALEADLVAAALRVAHALDYVGVLCVEFFIVADDGATGGHRLVVNEIAPRPHNSGHYTINACVTSQFAQQARIVAGLPLGDTRRHSAAVMLNLLGDLWFDGDDDRPTATLAPAADDVDAKATAAVDRLVANAEAAIGLGPLPDDGASRDGAPASTPRAANDATADDDEPAADDADGDADDDASVEPTDAGEDDAEPEPSAIVGADESREPDWRAILVHPGVNLHLYGKREARRGRKMGHVTIVAEHPDEARRIALEVAKTLGIAAW